MGDLMPFVRDALLAGKSRAEVRGVLLQAGWQEDEVDDALGAFAEVDFPIPVPLPRTSGSPREAFLYLVTFLMLYVASISLGNLLCGFVDLAMPDPVEEVTRYPGSYDNDSTRWLIASLLVAFPAWFLLTRSHLISYARDPQRRRSPVRRWLTYLTLFVAASTILTTMIVLLAAALGGEALARTFLKSVIVLGIAGSVFGFYLWELRRGEGGPAK